MLRSYCIRQDMEKDVANFVKKYLHCQDSKAGKTVPRLIGEVVHRDSVREVVHFGFLHVGAGGPLGRKVLGSRYINT